MSDGKALVSIRRITLRYRLLKLLQGDIDSAFKSLTIDGVTLDYDDGADRAIIEKIASFAKSGGVKRSGRRTDFSFIGIDLPFSLLIKNVRIRYRSTDADASFTIRSAEAVYNEVFRALLALVFFTAVFFAADFFTTAIFPPYMPLQQRALLRYYHNYYNRICAFIINPRT